MEDKVVKVEFKIWANDESEAELLGKAIGRFIDDNGRQGRKITAKKVAEAIGRWQDNILVRNGIINYFK